MRAFAQTLLLLSFLNFGCGQTSQPPIPEEIVQPEARWSVVDPDSMNEDQNAQREQCTAAVKDLGSQLMGELMTALDSGDPTVAVDVCRAKAPAIASHVSKTHGVAIGRTSHKLRNSANTPPQWAKEHVAALNGQPTFLAGPEGQLGALLPIKLKAECEMCHGAVQSIDEDLLESLRKSYPDDQATGFTAGDLRGWFWVEAPAMDEQPGA